MPLSPRLPLLRSLALVIAGALAGCGSEPAAPTTDDETAPGVVLGRAYAPGLTVIEGVTARVRWGDQEVAAPVNPDGTFALPLLQAVEGFGFLSLEPGPGAKVNAAFVLLTPGDVNGQGHVILSPAHWTVASGTHAGVEVAISPAGATDTRVMPGYWGTFFPYRQEGFLQTILDNTQWTGSFTTWPADRFPIPLALDRIGSTLPLTHDDSVEVWSHIEAMEEAMGRDVFRPAPLEEVRVLGGVRRAEDAVLLQVDSALTVRGFGDVSTDDSPVWTLGADARAWSGGPVVRVGFRSEDITGGRVAFDSLSFLRDRGLVVHELMHVLGVGHGCSWPSVQTYCGSLRRDLPTAQDVAHLEVLEAMRRMERAVGTRWGLVAAILGDRAVTLRQPPVPRPALIYGPANALPPEG